jgi:hypothetical protein
MKAEPNTNNSRSSTNKKLLPYPKPFFSYEETLPISKTIFLLPSIEPLTTIESLRPTSKMERPSCLLLWVLCVAAICVAAVGKNVDENNGWKTYLQSELNEWNDVPLEWQMSNTLPPWLQGQFIRNGPARFDFGGKRHYTMYMDGWGKLHSFKLNGSSVLSSGETREKIDYLMILKALWRDQI